jgi:heme oxygenase
MTTHVPLSQLIRDASRQQHSDAENSTFIARLMKGELNLAAYTRYFANLSWLYSALENQSVTGTPFPSSENLWDDRLERSDSIRSDLEHLGLTDPDSISPTPAMREYVDHINSLSGRADFRLVAHHYTRYLGDLSGGQAIAALVARHYGATEDQLSFYRFDQIPDLVRFKESYRSILDGLQLTPGEREALVDEVKLAFTFNQRVFEDLRGTEDRASKS